MTTATPELDSLNLIARDAASYAEGAGEPEFSQFLQIEARLPFPALRDAAASALLLAGRRR